MSLKFVKLVINIKIFRIYTYLKHFYNMFRMGKGVCKAHTFINTSISIKD